MEVLHPERHDAAPLRGVGRPEHLQAVDLPQLVQRIGHDLDLVRAHVFHPQVVQVVHRRAEPDRLRDVRRACLELVRDLVVGGVVDPDLEDHLTAAEERRHRLQQLRARPQSAGAGWAKHLVPAERQEVRVHLRHVRDQVRYALRAVDQDERAGRVRGVGHPADGIDRAEDVGHLRHADDLGPVEHPRHRLEIEEAVVGDGPRHDLRTGRLRHQLPRDQVGVVLHLGDDDLVARLQVRAPPRVRDQVERLRRRAREHDLALPGRTDERGDLRARAFVQLSRLFGQRVHAAVHVRVVMLVEVDEAVDHAPRLLRRGRVVQPDERLVAVHAALEDREVLANDLGIEHRPTAAGPCRAPRRPP